jgi:hypothetical protein
MLKFARCALLMLIGLSAGFGPGCSKKTTADPAAVAAAAKLPGGGDVIAALEKKDYDGAVAALLKAGRTVNTEDQQVQYMSLSRQVREKLSEAAPNDPKAAEALTTLRTMTMGR